ncbi:phytoene desaturase family protein [Halorubrum sp. DTA46]|uniref:phytoene desaturase family protein n=1 Tax=Halorubrum sp. DTA46 TaxID=3402162 RepID=UPI003AAAFBA6
MSERVLEEQSVGIVGGGVGGLSAAAHLANAGAEVTLYERAAQVGGVAGRIERDGFRFDTGPSWYLMPDVFERFFETFDRGPDDFYELERLDPHYRAFWDDGDRVDIPADPTAAADVFESYEAGAGEAFERYLDDAETAYEVGMSRFVLPGRSRLRDYVSTDVIAGGRKLNLLDTLDEHVGSYVDHPKLRQLLQYTLVFLGGSPYDTPALYRLMSHVDFELGVYYPQGGIYEVIEAIETVATDQGADVHTGVEVTAIEPVEDGVAVELGGDRYVHDRVVCNAPPEHVERELLPSGAVTRLGDYWDRRTYGPSAYLLYLGVEGDVDPLAHHTLALPTDWQPHFDAIFETPAWPENPTVYVNVPSQTDPTAAPEGHETVVALVPLAPGLDDPPEQRAAFRERVLDAIASYTGVDLRGRIAVEESACVSEFAERFDQPGGSALGLAHTVRQTGPLRPGPRVRGIGRLYYVGGSSNPGIGMPMCLLSGEQCAEAISEDVSGGRLDRIPFFDR